MPTIQEIFDLATRSKPNLIFPQSRINSTKHKLMMVFYKYSIQVVDENLTKNINDALFSITLPVPIKILERYDVEYDSMSVTNTLAQAAGGIYSQNNLTKKLTKKISDATSVLSAIIGAVNGLQINPFNVIHLKGAKLRKHNFRWKLHPENKDETNAIEKIIDTIRVNMHPKSEGFDVLLSYPNLINFRIFGPENPSHVFPSAPCVIDSFTVDRTGGDYPSFFAETGTPVVYQIHMSVTEILPMINRRGKLHASTILL